MHPSPLKKIAILLLVMSTIASSLTGLMTWANLGFSELFLRNWFHSFLLAMIVMMPIAFGLIALFTKVISRLLPHAPKLYQNLSIGFLMSLAMQSIMAVVTTYNNLGLTTIQQFKTAWFHAFITAYPTGLVLALILTTVIKPRLESFLKPEKQSPIS